jgi:hypothetical protein
METSDWIALIAVIMAFLALVISALSYAETKRTADANVSMAKASETSAKAAKDAVDFQIKVHREDNSANVVFHPLGPNDAVMRSYNPDASVYIGVQVVNEGPNIARDLRLALAMGDVFRLESEPKQMVYPNETASFHMKVTKAELGDAFDANLAATLNYRDGNGPRISKGRLHLKGRLTERDWETEWLPPLH